MELTSLTSAMLMSPTTPVASIPEVSAQADSSTASFLLAPVVADSLSFSEAAPVTESALSTEEAQPLLDNLQAQFSYREANGQRQSEVGLATHTDSQPFAENSVLGLPLNTVKRRVNDERVEGDSSTTTEVPLASEQVDQTVVLNFFFFPPPVERPETGQSDLNSPPLLSAEGMTSPMLVEQTPTDTLTASSSGTLFTTHSLLPKNAGQDVLTLPLTLSRDQTGYAQPLVTALSDHITWQISQHQQSVELQLHPAELGAMTITLHMNAGGLQLHIHAELPETQQLVQQTANELKENLTLNQGGQVEVDVSSQGHQQRRQTPQPQSSKVIAANNSSVTDTQASATDHSILITL